MHARRLALALALVLFVARFSFGMANDGQVEYQTPSRCIALDESGTPIEPGFDPKRYLMCLGDVF